MVIKQLSASSYLLKLSQGEKVKDRLHYFHQHIANSHYCTFSGIGGVSEALLGYAHFLPSGKVTYDNKHFIEELELLTCTGNIALKDNTSFAHVHVTLSNDQYRVFGGHLQDATVSMNVELIINIHEVVVERKHNKAMGLYMISGEEV